ncbi:hypothetical protein, partial, partial [Absidia glauca]
PASGYLDGKSTYIGVDPGVKTLASSVSMGSTQAGACILLANRFSELEEHLQDNPDTVKWLMDVKAANITAKSIDNNARSIDYRHQLQRKKMNDMKGDNTNSIMAIESHLSHLSQQRHTNVDDALVDHHRYGVQVQPKLQQFYQQSSWARKQKKGQPIFKLNAYNTAAKKLVPRKTEKPDTKGKARAAATQTTCQQASKHGAAYCKPMSTFRQSYVVSATNELYIRGGKTGAPTLVLSLASTPIASAVRMVLPRGAAT